MGDPELLTSVVTRWVSDDILRGKDPFDAGATIFSYDFTDIARLYLELLDALSAVTDHLTVSRDRQEFLSQAEPNKRVIFIPVGERFNRRWITSGLFADIVAVEFPDPPNYFWWDLRDIARAFIQGRDHPRFHAPEPPSVSDPGNPTPDEEFELLSYSIDVENSSDQLTWEQVEDQARLLPSAAGQLLQLVWDARKPVQQGWLRFVKPGAWDSSNLKQLTKDDWYRERVQGLSERYGDLYRAWTSLFRSYLVAHEIERDAIMMAPGTDALADLAAVTYERFERVWAGGAVFLDPAALPDVRGAPGSNWVREGGWFGDLALGLDPVLRLIDGEGISQLRANPATAAGFRRWLSGDLARLGGLAVNNDPGLTDALGQVEADYQALAQRALTELGKTASRTLRNRIKQAGPQGAIGGGTGLVTGGPPAMAVGMVAGAIRGAAGTPVATADADPVLLDLVRKALPRKRGFFRR